MRKLDVRVHISAVLYEQRSITVWLYEATLGHVFDRVCARRFVEGATRVALEVCARKLGFWAYAHSNA